MYSPAFGLGWHIWRRHRIGICLMAAYLLFLLVVRGVPSLSSTNAAGILSAPFGFGLLYLMGAFTGADADLVATASGYPTYLFTVPVRTRALVFWPMLYAMITVALTWLLFASAILVPQGQGDFLWWPAAMLAALQACLQALAWSPVPLPNLRWVLAFCALAGVTMLGVLGHNAGLSAGLLCVLFLGIIVLAGGFALHGVEIARQGENRERSWLPQSLQQSLQRDSEDLRPFTSAAQAQLWLEWKRNGLLLPLLVTCGALTFSALAFYAPAEWLPTGMAGIEISTCFRLATFSLLMTPLWSLVIGCCPRKAETYRKDFTLQPFLATRPLSSVGITLAKFRMAACSTLCAWAILLGFLALWLLLPARDSKTSGTILGLLIQHSNVKFSLFLAVLLIGLIGWTWKNQVCGLFIEFTGRYWLIQSYAVVFPMLGSAGIGWYFSWAMFHPAFVASLLRLVPGLALCGLALKLLAVACASVLLLRRGLVSQKNLALVLGGWLLLALGLIAMLTWLLPSTFVPVRYILLGITLCLPLARLLLAPLALDWNRHR